MEKSPVHIGIARSPLIEASSFKIKTVIVVIRDASTPKKAGFKNVSLIVILVLKTISKISWNKTSPTADDSVILSGPNLLSNSLKLIK